MFIKELRLKFFFDYKKCFISLALAFLFILIAFGNLLRFINLESNRDSLLITEVLLYLLCGVSAFFIKLNKWYWVFFIIAPAAIFGSFFQGALFQEFDPVALLYCVRLASLILSIGILAHIFLQKYGANLFGVLSWLLKCYAGTVLLSFIIFLFFPKTEDLVVMLEMWNIKFTADPHVDRFISVYLDPNLYAIIACIPFLLCKALYAQTRKMCYQIGKWVFPITIFLTHSRTGISAFIILYTFILMNKLIRRPIIHFNLKKIILAAVGLFIIISQNSIGIFLKRLSNMSIDISAWARWESCVKAFEIIKQNPLLGVGYNHAKQSWGIDSSLLFFIGCFGLVGLICALLFGMLYFFNLIKRLKGAQDTILKNFAYSFLFYIGITVLFSSQFTNVLFYIFWLIPSGVILIYLYENVRSSAIPKVRTRLAAEISTNNLDPSI